MPSAASPLRQGGWLAQRDRGGFGRRIPSSAFPYSPGGTYSPAPGQVFLVQCGHPGGIIIREF